MVLTILLQVSIAHAVTMRYALIIGNDIGTDEDGTEPFPRLLHAKQEARRLRQQLINVASFDSSPSRTRLLQNATRDAVVKAFRELSLQRERDSRLIADVESMFLLYYSGHGLSGRLLLADGPLPAKKLTQLFNDVGADFSIGVFDACYSGSLDTLLQKKGIRPTRGLNMVKELPEHVLSTKGSIWFVSSGADQPSYEDKQIGGVFTHYFIEALNSARFEGPGITLDGIWQYARAKTVAYTVRHNRHQVPEQFVSKLHSKAPVYFSFPNADGARIILSEKMHGKFALSHADGHLVKFFDKKAGAPKEIVVFPGKIELFTFGNSKLKDRLVVQLDAGETLVIHSERDCAPASRVGERVDTLFSKGMGVDSTIRASTIKPGTSFIFGSGYDFSLASYKMLHPRHRFFVPLRFDWQKWFAAAKAGFGYDGRNYPELAYEARMALAGISSGRRTSFKTFDASLGVALLGGKIWQKFKGREKFKSKGWEIQFNVEAGMLLTAGNGRWLSELSCYIGSIYSTGTGDKARYTVHLAGGLALSIFFRGV
ncbi:MAG: caspase family protein [Deltaproteobacteria bacterium]|nr:caspase family protein [Deltaproteobacteria bacterium]